MRRLLERRKLLLVPVLAALIVAGGNLLSATLRLDYHGTTDRSRNLFAYQQSGLRADVILLGSSHTRDGIIASQLADLLATGRTPGVEVFDLSQPGGSLLTTEIALRKVIASNRCPAVVAVEISPGSLNSGRDPHDIPTDGVGLAELAILLPELSKAGPLNDFMGSQLQGLQQLFDRLAHPPESHLVADAFEKRGSFHGRVAAGHQRALPREVG